MKKSVATLAFCLALSVVSLAGVIPQPVPCTGENCPPASSTAAEPLATNETEDEGLATLTTLLLDLVTLTLNAAS